MSDAMTEVCDGSELGRDKVLRDHGPEFDCKPASFRRWEWEAKMYLNSKGFNETLLGLNRDAAASADVKVKTGYEKSNAELFRYILRMLASKTEAGQGMRMRLQDEFGDDLDGYALWVYLQQWALDMTQTEVKTLKKEVDAVRFAASDSPDRWNFKMQNLLDKWMRIPEAKRGGDIADLSDKLLDRIYSDCPACRTYVEYVQALNKTGGVDMNDYQAVVKLLVDHHRQFGYGVASGGGGDGRRGGVAMNVEGNERSNGKSEKTVAEGHLGQVDGLPVTLHTALPIGAQ